MDLGQTANCTRFASTSARWYSVRREPQRAPENGKSEMVGVGQNTTLPCCRNMQFDATLASFRPLPNGL